MAIDKALYEAPQGLDALVVPNAEVDVEIEIELPGEEEEQPTIAEEDEFGENLAEKIDDNVLQSIGWSGRKNTEQRSGNS